MAVGGFSERLAFLLELDPSQAIAGMRRVGDAADRELGKADQRLDRLGGRMQTAGIGMLAFAGVAAGALFKFAQASEEANAAELRLQNSIQNSPKLVGESAEQFIELADAIQSKTAADGDQIIAAEAMLATFRLTADEIKGATPLVVDYARKFGVDLVSAATQVGKAMSGNLTTLERNGVLIDENRFATDRYGAVVDALRENVGGFAEQEGQTFAGQMERLKNEAGDLAEGIGVGVVDAFSGMAGAAQGVIGFLGDANDETLAGVGRWATYGTAIIAASGAVSLIGGSLIRLRGQIAAVHGAIGGLQGFKSLGIGGAVIGGIVAGGLALDKLEDSMISARLTMQDLVTAGDQELVEMLNTGAAAFEHFGVSQREVWEHVASESLVTLQRYRDAIAAAGGDVTELDEVITNEQRSQEAVAASTDAATAALADNAEAADVSATAHRTAADAVREHEEAVRDITDSMSDYIDEVTGGLATTAEWEEALDGLTDSLKENGHTLDVSTEAGRENFRQGQQVAEGLVALMQRHFEETGSLQGAIGAGQMYVEQLKDQLRQAGLTETEVQSYIDTLGLTPTEIATNFRVNTAEAVRQIQEIQRAAAGVAANSYEVNFQARPGQGPRAGGGEVEAGAMFRGGERGTEIFRDDAGRTYVIPGDSGQVIPNHRLAPAAAGGGGVHIEQLNISAIDIDDALRRLQTELAWSARGGQ